MLHLSANPAREAQQSRRQDQARLQEECERLRKLVCALERGGPVPADLEAACLPSSKEVAGRPAWPDGHRGGLGVCCPSVRLSCAAGREGGLEARPAELQ